MTKYRESVADEFVLKSTVEYIGASVDVLLCKAAHYKSLADEAEQEGSDDLYCFYLDAVDVCEAKAAAFARLLTKLAK